MMAVGNTKKITMNSKGGPDTSQRALMDMRQRRIPCPPLPRAGEGRGEGSTLFMQIHPGASLPTHLRVERQNRPNCNVLGNGLVSDGGPHVRFSGEVVKISDMLVCPFGRTNEFANCRGTGLYFMNDLSVRLVLAPHADELRYKRPNHHPRHAHHKSCEQRRDAVFHSQ